VYNRKTKRFLSTPIDNNGYARFGIYLNGKVKRFTVHRLVAAAFIENPEKKPCVNHKNGEKYDNNVENLEWVTFKENNHHAMHVLGRKFSPTAKLNEYDVKSIIAWKKEGFTNHQIKDAYGLASSTVSDIVNKKIWKHIANT
jgi:hypothetical protein